MQFKYVFTITLVSMSFLFSSCGEGLDAGASSVDMQATLLPVIKSFGEGGTEVTHPIEEEELLVLNGDFTSFSLNVVNNNENSLIITSIVAEVTDRNSGDVSTHSFPPQSYRHCARNNPERRSGGRFFAYLRGGGVGNALLGAYDVSYFYIDELVENELTSGYRAEVNVTVTGFFTSEVPPAVAASDTCETLNPNTTQPFLNNTAPFKKIIYFEISE